MDKRITGFSDKLINRISDEKWLIKIINLFSLKHFKFNSTPRIKRHYKKYLALGLVVK
jgi:NAD-dependent DNA ligase